MSIFRNLIFMRGTEMNIFVNFSQKNIHSKWISLSILAEKIFILVRIKIWFFTDLLITIATLNICGFIQEDCSITRRYREINWGRGKCILSSCELKRGSGHNFPGNSPLSTGFLMRRPYFKPTGKDELTK